MTNLETTNLQIIEGLKYFLTWATEHKEFFSHSTKDFTRNRKLNLERLALFIINIAKKSLSVELEKFFAILEKRKKGCTKSAFVQQRKKLKANFFISWNIMLIKLFNEFKEKDIPRWHGYRLIGIDGSTAYLPDKKEVKEYFGVQTNQAMEIPMGRVMNAVDLLSGISIRTTLLPIKYSEQSIAMKWIEHLDKDMIAIYDRGYTGFAFFYMHIHGQEQERFFIVRSRMDFNKEIEKFIRSGKQDQVVKLYPTKLALEQLHKLGFKLDERRFIKVRLVRIILKTGEVEVLVTNLMDKKLFSIENMKKLYAKRWGVETEYDAWKNKYQIEQFSGNSPTCVEQDFYATVFLANLHQVLISNCGVEIKKQNERRQQQYKINRNVTLGLLKDEVVRLFIHESPQIIMDKLKQLFIRYVEPVRPNRHYPRIIKFRRSKGKYHTLTNYKRAA